MEKKKAGELEFYGAEDVLTTALESQEHSGRVRAVGGYITPKQYFKLPREKKIRITKGELMAIGKGMKRRRKRCRVLRQRLLS